MRIVNLILLGLLSFNVSVYGMATEQIGPDREHPTVAQPEWPHGIVNLPRHPSRVYSMWVNGNENFYFQAKLDQLNELLDLFSKARLRDHEVWIKRGQPRVESFGKEVISYNVNLRILSGIARAMHEREQNRDSLEPQLTLYLTEAVPVEKLVWPDNLIIHCDIPGFKIQGKTQKPSRRPRYGRVWVGDEPGTADFLARLRTQISLWESGLEHEIKLTQAGRYGWFQAELSGSEMADLNSGRSWLTITVGNWLTDAKKTDPRFPAEYLGDRTTAKVVKIPKP